MSLTTIVAYHPDTTDLALLEKDGKYYVGVKGLEGDTILYHRITSDYDDKCEALDRLDSFE